MLKCCSQLFFVWSTIVFSVLFFLFCSWGYGILFVVDFGLGFFLVFLPFGDWGDVSIKLFDDRESNKIGIGVDNLSKFGPVSR